GSPTRGGRCRFGAARGGGPPMDPQRRLFGRGLLFRRPPHRGRPDLWRDAHGPDSVQDPGPGLRSSPPAGLEPGPPCPVPVIGLLRTVQSDLTDKRRRLDAAVRQAEAAAEAKSDFLANMSHEI